MTLKKKHRVIERFISDFHWGDKWLSRKRGFKSLEDMHDYIVDQHNAVVHEEDITFIMGDLTKDTNEFYYLLDKMKGIKRIILGNHDKPKHIRELLNHVDSVSGIIKYKGILLSHCPVHPQELQYRAKINIHGHLHDQIVSKEIVEGKRDTDGSIPDNRYINVSCEQINFQPKTFKELGILNRG
jgi:calcineurin-like phosphoesterase family protein